MRATWAPCIQPASCSGSAGRRCSSSSSSSRTHPCQTQHPPHSPPKKTHQVESGEHQPDAPDLSLRLTDTLVNPETEIKSVTQDAIYDSAKRFEDLPLTPELLKVPCVLRVLWLCCAVLCCAVLCCAVLCCAVLCCGCVKAKQLGRHAKQPALSSINHHTQSPNQTTTHQPPPPPQGLYSEMKFDHPSRIQATTLPMILLPDQAGVYRDLIAQVGVGLLLLLFSKLYPAICMLSFRHMRAALDLHRPRIRAPSSTLTPTIPPGPQRERQDHLLRAGHAEQVGGEETAQGGCLLRICPHSARFQPPSNALSLTQTRPQPPSQGGPGPQRPPSALHVPHARAGAAEPPRPAPHGQVHHHQGRLNGGRGGRRRWRGAGAAPSDPAREADGAGGGVGGVGLVGEARHVEGSVCVARVPVGVAKGQD